MKGGFRKRSNSSEAYYRVLSNGGVERGPVIAGDGPVPAADDPARVAVDGLFRAEGAGAAPGTMGAEGRGWPVDPCLKNPARRRQESWPEPATMQGSMRWRGAEKDSCQLPRSGKDVGQLFREQQPELCTEALICPVEGAFPASDRPWRVGASCSRRLYPPSGPSG